MIISMIIGILGTYFINKTVNFTLIAVFIYFLIIIFLPKLAIWKYIKNSFYI